MNYAKIVSKKDLWEKNWEQMTQDRVHVDVNDSPFHSH